jgi:hypothetical protein
MESVRRKRDYEALLDQFWPVFEQRPIKDNQWGCQLPHLFALWTFLREASPTHVIESGVWKGQTTWLITATLPDAVVLSLDPFPERREWSSPQVHYSTNDFAYQDLGAFPPETTLAFFDDHVHPFLRLMLARAWGIRHLVFDDNYPPGTGDPSMAQFLLGAPAGKPTGFKNRLQHFLKHKLAPGEMMLAAAYSPETLSCALERIEGEYEVFPPLAESKTTRWGTSWRESFGRTPPCLDPARLAPEQRALVEGTALAYSSMCKITLGPAGHRLEENDRAERSEPAPRESVEAVER